MKSKQYPLPIAAMSLTDCWFYARVLHCAIEQHKTNMVENENFDYSLQAEITKEVQLERDKVFQQQLGETADLIAARIEQLKRERRKQTK